MYFHIGVIASTYCIHLLSNQCIIFIDLSKYNWHKTLCKFKVYKVMICCKPLQTVYHKKVQFSSVHSLSHVWLFATPWTAACQASLSITNSQSILKLTSIELVTISNHLILCRPHLFSPSLLPSIGVFYNESVLHIRWPNLGVSTSASVLPMNIQSWFPLGWTGWISLQNKGLSRVFSNTTIQKQHHHHHQFFGTRLSL